MDLSKYKLPLEALPKKAKKKKAAFIIIPTGTRGVYATTLLLLL